VRLRLRCGAGAALLGVALGALAPATPVWAEGLTPSPTPTAVTTPTGTGAPTPSASPEPDPTTTMGATATSLAGLSAPVRDITTTVRDIITTVASLDGTETQRDTTSRRTLILDSKVLFPEDRATLSSAARARLRSVARQIVASGATGTVRVDGYTDDQGSAAHGLVLSRQRARAVRGVLAPLLAGTGARIAVRGLGEANPRVPNHDRSGRPIPANQAKNRRVEITFSRSR